MKSWHYFGHIQGPDQQLMISCGIISNMHAIRKADPLYLLLPQEQMPSSGESPSKTGILDSDALRR
jgi:hypothetical protein